MYVVLFGVVFAYCCANATTVATRPAFKRGEKKFREVVVSLFPTNNHTVIFNARKDVNIISPDSGMQHYTIAIAIQQQNNKYNQ